MYELSSDIGNDIGQFEWSRNVLFVAWHRKREAAFLIVANRNNSDIIGKAVV